MGGGAKSYEVKKAHDYHSCDKGKEVTKYLKHIYSKNYHTNVLYKYKHAFFPLEYILSQSYMFAEDKKRQNVLCVVP